MHYRFNSIITLLGATLLCALAAITLALPKPTAAQDNAQGFIAKTDATQLETFLNQAYNRTVEYTGIFKDLMAEERHTIELYNGDGQLIQRRRIISDLVIYQSQVDSKTMVEYRNVREVDGVAIADQQERAAKLAERLVKVDSVSKELDRVDREASRYDLNYSLKGYTLNQAMPLQKEVREVFKFEEVGRETIDGHEVIVINYKQVAKHPQLQFKFSLPKVKASAAYYKGRLWLDARNAQLWREEREIVVNLPKLTEPVAIMRFEFRYTPSKFNILVPQRITFSTLGSIRNPEGLPPVFSPGGRVTFEYGAFEIFDITVRPGNFSPQRSQ